MVRQYFIGVSIVLLAACSQRVSDSGDDVADDTGGEPDPAPPSLPTFVVEPIPAYEPVQGTWPAAAFDGTQYLAVWEDHRLRRPILYGGRVTADGTALDPFGFRILDNAPETEDPYESNYRDEPAVAFDGENFLVVSAADGRVSGVRVSPSGEVLDPGGFVIADTQLALRPSTVFDGEQYLVAWAQSDPDSSGIFQARVRPDSTVLDPGGVLIHEIKPEGNYWRRVGMSFDGTNSLLSWEGDGGIYDVEPALLFATRASVDGTLIDETPIRLSPEGEHVWTHAAGFDGTNHVIAWSSFQGGTQASRVTPEGTLLDPDGFLVDDIKYRVASRLGMAAGDGRSTIIWSGWTNELAYDYAPIRASLVTTDGTTSLHPDDAFPRGGRAIVAGHPDGALVLWRDAIGPNVDYASLVGTRLDATGTPVGNAVAPALTASRQDVKAVASDGQNSFVLWTDTRDPTGIGRALWGARVGADGTPLDAEALQLTTTPVEWGQVVFDGVNFMVTWQDLDECSDDCGDAPLPSYAVRVNLDGERLDQAPVQLPLCGQTVGASDGTYTLLTGQNCDGDEHMAVLLDHDGVVASDLESIPVPNWNGGAAAFDGSHYLAAWHGYGNHVPLVGQRITQAGTLEGPDFVIFESEFHHLGIAGGGGNHLVVWDTDIGIQATRVSSDGQVLDPGGLLIAALENSSCWEPDLNLCSESSVVFDGEDFVIAWREPSIPGHASSLDLYTVKVSPEGEVSPRSWISLQPEREGAPFLAVNGEGQVLAAYNLYMPGPPYDTRRAVATLLP